MRRTALLLALAGTVLVVPAPAGAQTGTPVHITSVKVVRASGVRVVRVSLHVVRHCDAVAALRRSGRTVAYTRGHLMPGNRVMRIRLPRRAPAGTYLLRLSLKEPGKTTALRRYVRLPRR